MNFKTLLFASSMVALSGCSKAPVEYVEAAERMAKSNCDGIVTFTYDKDEIYSRITERGVIFTRDYRFTCISDKGSERMYIPFKDIPLKYFKQENNNDQ